MEKTTKKSGIQPHHRKKQSKCEHDIRYSKTTPKEVSQFFSKHTNVKDQSDAPGVYQPVEPIQTCIGPIGKFVLQPGVFPRHASMGFFGKRRTGKSFSLRWIMYNCFRHIPFGVCFTNTSINGFWQTYIPPFLVFQGLQMHRMDALINRQKGLIAKWKKEHPEECKKNPDAYKEAPELAAFVIFDDVIADRVAMQWNKDINTFFVEGRHLCITTFITTQHVKGIGPMLRGNLDIAQIQPMFQKEARMVLADLYGGFLPHDLFLKLMDEVVVDEPLEGSTPQDPKKYVRTMIVNDFENTPDPQTKFKWSEAENPDDVEPGWRLVAEEYWKQNERQIKMMGAIKGQTFDPIDRLDQFRSTARGG